MFETLRCSIGAHDWRFVKERYSFFDDEPEYTKDRHRVLWKKEMACQRCHKHSILTVFSRKKEKPDYVAEQGYLPATHTKDEWDMRCPGLVPDRDGPGTLGLCGHPRYKHGKAEGEYGEKEFVEGSCVDCHCRGFRDG